jgi:sec-independent protein translocase protein TatA
MPNIGLPEIVIVLVIALIVFGPKRLPDLARSLGSGVREFKQSIGSLANDDAYDARPRVAGEVAEGDAPAPVAEGAAPDAAAADAVTKA